MTNRWWNWLRGKNNSTKNLKRRFRLDIDRLEDRITPVATTLTWTGVNSGSWADPGNWNAAGGADHGTPQNQDILVFQGSTPHNDTVNDVATVLTLDAVNFNLVSGSIANYSIGGSRFFLDAAGAGADLTVAGGTQTINLGTNQFLGLTSTGSNTMQWEVASGATLHVVSPMFSYEDGQAPGPGNLDNLTINFDAGDTGTVQLDGDNNRLGDAGVLGDFQYQLVTNLIKGTVSITDADALGDNAPTNVGGNGNVRISIVGHANTNISEPFNFVGANTTYEMLAGSDNLTQSGDLDYSDPGATSGTIKVDDVRTATKGQLTLTGHIFDNGDGVTFFKDGAGTVKVTSSNGGLDGDTSFNIVAGVLEMANNRALGANHSTDINVQAGGTLRLAAGVDTSGNADGPRINLAGTLDGPEFGPGTATYDKRLTLSGTPTINVITGSTLNLNGAIVGGLGVGYTKTGGGELGIGGGATNTYTGITTIEAGTVEIHKVSGLGDSTPNLANYTRVNSGATLIVDIGGNPNITEVLKLNGGTLLAEDSFHLTSILYLEQASFANVVDGEVLDLRNQITGNGGITFNANGEAGTVSMVTNPGTLANDYTGDTILAGGDLDLNKGDNVTAIPGNLFITPLATGGSDATVRVWNDEQIGDQATVTITQTAANDATLVITDNSTESIGKLVMTGGHVLDGTGSNTLRLTGNNVTINASAVSESHIDVDTFVITQNTTFNVDRGSAEDVDLEVTSVISDGPGTFGITKSGIGIMLFSGHADNQYFGTTTVTAGALWLNRNADNKTIRGPLVVGTGSPGNGIQGSAIVRIMNDAQIDNTASWTINYDGRLTLDDHVSEEVLAGTVNGGIIDVGEHSDLKIGAGNLTMTGGQINLGETGELDLQDPATQINVNSSNFLAQILGGRVDLNVRNRTFNVAGDPGLTITSDLVNGALNGQGIVKTGGGTLNLYGNNTYTGPTNIQQGRLNIYGNQPFSPISVAALGILGGGGTAADGDQLGPVTVNGGKIDPGAQGFPAVLKVQGNIVFNSGTYHVDFFKSVITNVINADQLQATGSVIFNGNSRILEVTTGQVSRFDKAEIIIANGGVFPPADPNSATSPFTSVPSNIQVLRPDNFHVDIQNIGVTQIAANFDITNTTVTFGTSVTLTLSLTIPGLPGNPLVPFFGPPPDFNNLTVTVDGKPHAFTTNSDGKVVVVLSAADLTVGTHSIVANFTGDNNYSATSATSSITVTQVTATALAGSTLTLTPSSISVGQTALATFTLVGVPVGTTATGTVTFRDVTTNTAIATVPLSGNIATATVPSGDAISGGHTIQATYSGDLNFASVSKTATLTVTALSTSVGFTALPTSISSGQTLSLVANVKNPTTGAVIAVATGTMTFFDDVDNSGTFNAGDATLATVSVANGLASTTSTAVTSVGTHHLRAFYSGDGINVGSATSGVQNVTVSGPATPFRVDAANGPTPAAVTVHSVGSGRNASGYRTQVFSVTNTGATSLNLSSLYFLFPNLTCTWPAPTGTIGLAVFGQTTQFHGANRRQVASSGTLGAGQTQNFTVTYYTRAPIVNYINGVKVPQVWQF